MDESTTQKSLIKTQQTAEHELKVGHLCAEKYGELSLEHFIGMNHDCIEEGWYELNMITHYLHLISGYAMADIHDAMDAISRRKDETYFEYIKRCCQCPVAARVKRVDLQENRFLRGNCPESLQKRYDKAIKILEEHGYTY